MKKTIWSWWYNIFVLNVNIYETINKLMLYIKMEDNDEQINKTEKITKCDQRIQKISNKISCKEKHYQMRNLSN